MKIAVYAICLNEEAFAERFAASVREADLIQVADTGSTDRTVSLLEASGVEVRHIRIRPWRFDDARNAALALLPDDIDICVSLDVDTVLSSGWRQALERAWKPGVNLAYYHEIWARHVDGRPRRFLNNRIHARHGFRWKGPCHEFLVADRTKPVPVLIKDLTGEQFADPTKNRAQYMPLLELAVKEAPHEPRWAHYLGREFYFHRRFAEAAAEFERYLALPGSGYIAERNSTQRLLAQCQIALGDRAAAMRNLMEAVAEAPQLRGAWTDLAFAHYQTEDWTPCYEAAVKAIATPASGEYGEEANVEVTPEDLASVSAWRLSRFQEALRYGRQALALAPTVERLRANVENMERALGPATAPSEFGQTAAGVIPRGAKG